MTVIEIVKEYLVKNGFIGLTDDKCCSCGLSGNDLLSCNSPDLSDCKPAIKVVYCNIFKRTCRLSKNTKCTRGLKIDDETQNGQNSLIDTDDTMR